MAWVTIKSEVPGSWRFKRLKKIMGWDDERTMGTLALFWMYSQEQDVAAGTKEKIKSFFGSDTTEDSDKLFQALLECEYVSPSKDQKGEFDIHGNASTLVRKALNQSRASKAGKASGKARKSKQLELQVGEFAFNSSQVTSSQVTSSQVTSLQEGMRGPSPDEPAATEEPDERKQAKSTPLWHTYCEEYQRVHHQEPAPRNAKVNSQLCNLVRWFGVEIAIDVVKHYFKVPSPYYHRNFHPVGVLVKDAHSIYGSLSTGKYVTNSQARQMDEQATTLSQLERVRNGEL